MNLSKIARIIGGAGASLLLLAGTSAFAASPTLFGNATQDVSVVHLMSNASSTPAYGGIAFPVATTTLSSFVSSGDLSTTYNVLSTECGGGSPRFQINVASSSDATSTGNIFAYLGPPPNYTGCTQNSAVDSGNLLNGTLTLDTSQLPGGTFYDTLSHALSAYGDYDVTGVQLVADGGWAVSGGVQDVDVSSADVGGTSLTLGSGTTTTASTTLAAPTGLSPNGATLTPAQWTSATWDAVSATSTPVSYQYESSLSSGTNTDGSFVTPAYQSGWLTTNSISTAGTAPGTYWWNVRAMDNSGNVSPWSGVAVVTVANATSTGTTTSDVSQVVAALQGLENQFPDLIGPIQALINELLGSGTTVGNTGSPSIDQNGASINAGATLDFTGRNFGHEESVIVTLNGSQVASAHADGGGNFSTGSLMAPTTPGSYTYTFTGSSGDSAAATVTVQ